jgi:hypothetical protein
MSNKFALMFVCSILGSLFSFNVHAFPISPPPESVGTPAVTLVHGFCALNYHRGADGHCVSNGPFYTYPPSTPTQMFAPLGCPYGFYLGLDGRCSAPIACTNGYYLGPYGQCFPYPLRVPVACTNGYYLGPYGQCFPYPLRVPARLLP